MKFKLLLTGNNKLVINEFFTQMDFSFECISTSPRYDDILNHMKYYQPDAFVYCLHGESPDELKKFVNAENAIFRRKLPVIIIGDPEDCDMFGKIAPLMQVTMIQRPISSRKMEETIVKLLDGVREEKEREERRQLEYEREELERSELERDAREKARAGREKEIMDAARAILGLDAVDDRALTGVDTEAKAQTRRHVLIVDDDSGVLKLIKGYLAEKYDVATAISGKVALKFLESRKTDLVLLDYEMPGENGPTVLSKIRSDAKTKNLPVIFLTGVTDRKKIQEVLSMKPQGYLLKPIEAEKLYEAIDKVFA